VDRLFTPLLRRLYGLLGTFLLIYLGFVLSENSVWNKERLYHKLLGGSEIERSSAGFDLAFLGGEEQLLRALRSRSAAVRTVALNSLWELWARAAGHTPFQQIQAANQAIQAKSFGQALEILNQVTDRYPGFAEGWNRRATLYCEMGRFQESVADARRAVSLNPNHFGAWQGMGICQVRLGNLAEACRCLRVALRIMPHDQSLQTFLTRCEELLRLLSPGERIPRDTV
jgi:tetratricopeptide (TPR) repeat protein